MVPYGLTMENQPKRGVEMTDQIHTVAWSDVRDEYVALVDGKVSSQPTGKQLAARWRKDERADWTGCTKAQMKEWLRIGYKAPEFKLASLVNSGPEGAGKFQFGEDGEMLIDLALSGFDYPFLTREPIAPEPGMHIIAGISMSSSTNVRVIAEYGAWIAGLLYKLETDGVDVALDVENRAKGSWTNRPNTYVCTRIRVKREGELSDFTSWSALFSAGGFRKLMFTAKVLVAQRAGQKLKGDLGSPASGTAWSVAYDPNTNTLRIACPPNATSFPAEEMDRQLARELAKAE